MYMCFNIDMDGLPAEVERERDGWTWCDLHTGEKDVDSGRIPVQ